jgi:hypothetical protein
MPKNDLLTFDLCLIGGLDTAEPWQGTWSGGVFVECVGKQENEQPKTPAAAARPAAQAQQPPQQQQPSPNDSQGQKGCIDLTHEDHVLHQKH